MAEAFAVDGRYEFQAPQFYDFKACSPSVCGRPSSWFETAQEDVGLRSPLAEVPANALVSPVPAPAQAAATTTKKKSNLVTSWESNKKVPATAPRPLPATAVKASSTATVSKAGLTKPAPATEPRSRTRALATAAVGRAVSAKRPLSAVARSLDDNISAIAEVPKQPAKQQQVTLGNKESKQEGKQQAQREEPAKAKSAEEQQQKKPRIEPRITRSTTKAQLRVTRSASTAPVKPAAASSVKPKAGAPQKPAQPQRPAAVARPTAAARARGVSVGRSGAARQAAPATNAAAVKAGAGSSARRAAAAAGSKNVGTKASSKAIHIQVKPMKVPGDRLKKVLAPRKVLPARSTKPLTLPDEVELATSKRARHCEAEEALAANPSKTPFKPLAVKVKEFHSKTPGRFKARPLPAEPFRPPSITEPKEPVLWTTTRARPARFKPREEEEAEEMAKIPKFHAQPLNPAILNSAAPSSRPEGEAKTITEPQPFHFVTDDRATRRAAADPIPEEKVAEFKAQPLNKSILVAPVGVPEKPRHELTIPMSPMLRTKRRALEKPPKEEEEEPKQFHAQPVPNFLQVPCEFQSREVPAPTQPEPFSLYTELRGKAHQERLQAKLSEQEVAEREARAMRAQPLPASLDMPIVPPRPEPRGLTVPQPFKLHSEMRHEEYTAEFVSAVQQEEAQKRAEAEFKARPMWRGMPFKPAENNVPLTVPDDVVMATDARAAERQAFDQAMADKWRLIEEQKALEETEKQRAEEEARREYRKNIKFEARPMPDFSNPFAAMPSEKPLTNPVTPKLGKRKARGAEDSAGGDGTGANANDAGSAKPRSEEDSCHTVRRSQRILKK